MLPRDLTGRTGTHRSEAARMIHGGSLRNCGDAKRDGRVEPREAEAYLKEYVEVGRGEPARQYVGYEHTGLSKRRVRSCSRALI